MRFSNTDEKLPRFYPADDVKKPLINKLKAEPIKLKASITPGTVLIILAGSDKPDVVIGSYKEEVLEDKGSF